ncbi:MAG: sigma-70 family RNA polymerase sigma factor [Candidatus Cloacimonetes bacterium]|nr:sigma-70 family RNA polymerase sigma factor [Candidatus Cloacimonadota bacterium]MBS3767332.1 sigma-70 family RNA polymerase sigma factor [Candidatus Cloacimonadota bacterium]
MDEEIIKKYLPLVKKIASKYSYNDVPYDDLIQEGTIGLWKAWQRYDESREAKFSTYAVYWIKKMISEAVEKDNKASLDAVSYDDTRSTNPENHKGVKPEQTIEFPDSFPQQEKNILTLLYGLGGKESYDLGEIGEKLNLRRERVRQIKEKALRRLRKLGIELY